MKQIIEFIRWLKKYLVIRASWNEIQPQALIPRSTSFEHHGIGVVINRNVRFGENNVIHQNVTFGSRDKNGCFIVTGDNCFFGCGCAILGVIRIGNNVKIGANTVVLKDVPDNTTVTGVWK